LICTHGNPIATIPIVGAVCGRCLNVMQRRMVLDGLVEGPSCVELCEKLDSEIKQRVKRMAGLIEQATKGMGDA